MDRKLTSVDATPQPMQNDLVERIWQHYRDRPCRAHFGAWLIIGLTLGFLLSPNLETISIIAFMISGLVCATILAVLTYPVSDDYRMTLVGAGAGLLFSFIYAWTAQSGPFNFYPMQISLLIGSLIGATSLMWLGPIRMWLRLFRRITGISNEAKVPTAIR